MKEENRIQQKKIVVVDDDESIRKTFFLLFHRNYRVYLAANSKEALKRFLNVKVDLLIVDLRLPEIDGLEMITRFREKGYRGEVILISAYPDLIEPERLSRLSISHFFVKPLDLEALNRSVDYLLKEKESNQPLL
ncbi:MAG: response regulator [Candidatus Aminicenantales bacterium]